MTYLTRKVTFLPNLDAACDRITARAKAEAARDRAKIVRQAKRVIDDPRGYTDEQLREVCAAFMAMSPTPVERADDWNLYWLRARDHIAGIDIRAQVARNRAKALLTVQPEYRNGKKLQAVTLGFLCALAVIVALRAGGVV